MLKSPMERLGMHLRLSQRLPAVPANLPTIKPSARLTIADVVMRALCILIDSCSSPEPAVTVTASRRRRSLPERSEPRSASLRGLACGTVVSPRSDA
uniref:Uncharacterized protein n=1 Tax=Steinernema glaseri TaxID=37863 RepID=A0A1I8ATM6_9BILA